MYACRRPGRSLKIRGLGRVLAISVSAAVPEAEVSDFAPAALMPHAPLTVAHHSFGECHSGEASHTTHAGHATPMKRGASQAGQERSITSVRGAS